MTNLLHQINIAYESKEDRLLMRTTTQHGQEYRIWLTRRFTGLLFGILNKTMEQYGGAPVIGSEEKTRKMFKSGAFEKKFDEEKSTSFPVGENGFLAFAVKTGNTREGNLYLEILPETGRGVTFNLDKQMQYMLHNLLSQGSARADWSLTSPGHATTSQKH